MRPLLVLLLSIFIVGLFLYSRLLPYKDRLDHPYRRLFNFFSSIFSPLLNGLRGLVKPFRVGSGLSVDLAPILLLILFLIILNAIQ